MQEETQSGISGASPRTEYQEKECAHALGASVALGVDAQYRHGRRWRGRHRPGSDHLSAHSGMGLHQALEVLVPDDLWRPGARTAAARWITHHRPAHGASHQRLSLLRRTHSGQGQEVQALRL